MADNLQIKTEKLINYGNEKFGLSETTLRGILDNATTGEYTIESVDLGDGTQRLVIKTAGTGGSGSTDTSLYKSVADGSITNVTADQLNGVTALRIFAYAYCLNLTSVRLQNTVTEIGGFAFIGCESLTDVELPSSITHIGGNAFYECFSLTEMTILAETPPQLDSDAISESTTTIYVPNGCKSAYESSDHWAGLLIRDNPVTFIELNADGTKPI